MTHQSRATRFLIVAAIAIVGLGALAGAAAADTTTLAGDGSDHITGFNASASDHIEYTLSSDGTDFGTDGTETVFLNVTDSNGEEHVQVSNTSIASADTSYTFNLSHEELDTIPGDAGANSTVSIAAWGENSSGDVSTGPTTFDATIEFHDGYAVIYVGDAATAGDVTGLDAETTVEERWARDDKAFSTVEADSVGLGENATGTTVHVVMANTSGEDVFSAAADSAWFGFGSYEEGDFIPAHRLEIEDHNHAVFMTEVPDGIADGYTYAETTERGGNDAYAIYVDEDYEDETSLDITAKANQKYGFLEKRSVRSAAFDSDLAWITGAAASVGPVGGGLVA